MTLSVAGLFAGIGGIELGPSRIAQVQAQAPALLTCHINHSFVEVAADERADEVAVYALPDMRLDAKQTAIRMTRSCRAGCR